MESTINKGALVLYTTYVLLSIVYGIVALALGFPKETTQFLMATAVGFGLFILLFDLGECGSECVLQPGFGTLASIAFITLMFLIALAYHTSHAWVPPLVAFVSSLHNALATAAGFVVTHKFEAALAACATSATTAAVSALAGRYGVTAISLFLLLASTAALLKIIA